MKKITVLITCLLSLAAYAQEEIVLPENAMDSVVSVTQLPRKTSPCIDTLQTSVPGLQVVFYEDHTWDFIKDVESFAQDSLFTECWQNHSPNPYQIDLADMPERVTLFLVDSLSNFACPHQRAVFSKFGWRRNRMHMGVDLPLPMGTPVYAAFDGKVRIATKSKGYGNVVTIRHLNGLETTYGHLSKINVSADDWVHAGDVIGLGGSTGRSTGPHLHFETRYKGLAFDPQWIIDFEKGILRHRIFVLKRRYMQPGCKYVPESEDEEDEIYGEDEALAAAVYHKVKSGDTLSALAVKYHTTVSTICKLSGIKSTSTLRVGQTLRVR